MSTRRLAVILACLTPLVGIAAAAAPQAGPDPQAQIVKLQRQLRQANNKVQDQQDEIDAQDAVISDQTATITRLRNRIANWPDPLDVITSRDADGLWQAMRAIWLAFPTLDPGSLCGYDRSYVPGDPAGFTLTSFTFYRWSGC